MSSTLFIRREQDYKATWMPSSGIFEEILDSILLELDKIDKDLSEQIMKGCIPGSYASIADLSATDFDSLLTAAQIAYDKKLFNIRQDMDLAYARNHNLELGFATATVIPFGQLIAMLRADDRAPIAHSKLSKVMLGANVYWTSPMWLKDFVLEYLASNTLLYTEQRDLSEQLLKARQSDTVSLLLDELSTSGFCRLLGEVRYLASFFLPTDKGNIGYSSRFTPEMSTKCTELLTLFQTTSKYHSAANC